MGDSDREPVYTARERFTELLCSQVRALYAILAVCVFMFVLSLVSLPFLEPGTASYVLLQVDLALLVVFTTGISLAVYRCHRYRA